jgi:hypothetical protein
MRVGGNRPNGLEAPLIEGDLDGESHSRPPGTLCLNEALSRPGRHRKPYRLSSLGLGARSLKDRRLNSLFP